MRLAIFALITAAVAPAGWTSPWVADRFAALSEKTIERDGVTISNCHLEWAVGAAIPKCYVMNRSRKVAEARIDFALVDGKGEPVVSTTLQAWPLADMNGVEFSQSVPISADDAKRIDTGKIRAWVAVR